MDTNTRFEQIQMIQEKGYVISLVVTAFQGKKYEMLSKAEKQLVDYFIAQDYFVIKNEIVLNNITS